MKKLLLLLLISIVSFHTKAQWTALTDGHLDGLEQGTNYPMLKHGSFIYIGTIAGVYRSDPSGNAWVYKSNGIAALSFDLEIFGLAGNTAGIYAATYSGVIKSTNNGDSWAMASTGLPPGMVESLFSFQNDLFAVAFDGSDVKLYSSTDDAGTWAEVYTFINYSGSAISTAGAIYLIDDVDIIKSTDGVVFASISAPVPGGGVYSLAGNDTYLYAMDYLYIYRLELSTGIWVQKTNGIPAGNEAFSLVYVNDTLYSFTIDFLNASFALYRSTDQGNNWTKRNASGLFAPFLSNAISVPGAIVGWFTDGLYRSSDGGNSWTSSQSGLKVTSHDQLMAMGNTLLTPGNGYTSRLLRSTDAGNSFSFADAGTSPGARARILMSGSSFLVAQFITLFEDSNYLYKSIDNGQSWTLVNTPSGLMAWELKGASGSTIYIFSDTTIYMTSNSGASWSPVSGLGLDYVMNIYGNGSSTFVTGYSSFSNEFIMESTDNGATWHTAKTGLTSFASIVDMAFSASSAFAVADNAVCQWASGTWTKAAMNGISPTLYINSLDYNQGKLYVSTDSGVFYSKDMGANWVAMSNTGLPTGVSIVSLAFVGQDVFAGTFYNGVYKAPNPFTGISSVPSSGGKLHIYPNPSSSIVYMDYELSQKEVINISIYDMNGRNVLAVVNEVQNAGRQQMEVSTSGLAPGIYNVVMRSEDAFTAQKLLITR